MPANRSGDLGVYSVFEQKLYRVGNDDDRGIGIFVRVSYSPPDRNIVDLYSDAGVEFVGLNDKRPKDKFGIAVAYARVSPWAQALDTDFQRLNGPNWPSRSYEGLLTAVYQYEVRQAGHSSQIFNTSRIPPGARPIRLAPISQARFSRMPPSSG